MKKMKIVDYFQCHLSHYQYWESMEVIEPSLSWEGSVSFDLEGAICWNSEEQVNEPTRLLMFQYLWEMKNDLTHLLLTASLLLT